MGLTTSQRRGARLALFSTLILLAISSWSLYNENSVVLHIPLRIPLNLPSKALRLPKSDASQSLLPKRVAVLLETRPLNNIVPLILHYSAVLGPGWPIHIFTSSENKDLFVTSQALGRKINSSEIVLRILPEDSFEDYRFHEHFVFSQFLIQPWLWEELAPAEYVLFFKADSMICSRSEQSVDDFLEYDFIGAPLEEEEGVSGGLSLRSRAMMLDAVNKADWELERYGDRGMDGKPKPEYEARWFWKKMKESALNGTVKANLPSMEIARSFEGFENQPLFVGYDQVQTSRKMKEILDWCPEYGLSITSQKQFRKGSNVVD